MYILLQVHARESRSFGLTGRNIYWALPIDPAPAAAERPEDQPCSADEIAAGNAPEKAAVQAEL